MQQYADIYLLHSNSTCFGRHSTHHSIPQDPLTPVRIRSRWKEVTVPLPWHTPEVADTVFSTPDDGCVTPETCRVTWQWINVCIMLHRVGPLLTPMKILQRNLNRSTFVVWEMKRNVSVVRLIVATQSSSPPEMPGSVASGTSCSLVWSWRQAVREDFNCLTPKGGKIGCPETSLTLSLCCATFQKSAELIYIEAEAWNPSLTELTARKCTN